MAVSVEKLDYDYIDGCDDASELTAILEVLQSGKEGRWPDLERHCEAKLMKVLPAKQRRRREILKLEPSAGDISEMRQALSAFIDGVGEADKSMLGRREGGAGGAAPAPLPVQQQRGGRDPSHASAEHAARAKDIFGGGGDSAGGGENPIAAGVSPPAPAGGVAKLWHATRALPPVRGTGASGATPVSAKNTPGTIRAAGAPPGGAALALAGGAGEPPRQQKAGRIGGYDWDAWEKYDADAAVSVIDKGQRAKPKVVPAENKKRRKAAQSPAQRSSCNHMPREQRHFLAAREKQKGNECFRAQEFDEAHARYSKAIDFLEAGSRGEPRCSPALGRTLAVVYANRAMAGLKLKQFDSADQDCTVALRYDPSYTKALSRRGMSRHRRGMYLDAIADFETALEMEPGNRQVEALLKQSRVKYDEVGGIGADREDAPPRNVGSDGGSRTGFRRISIIEDDGSDDSSDDDSCGRRTPPPAAAAQCPPQTAEPGLSPRECWESEAAAGKASYVAREFEAAASSFSNAIRVLGTRSHTDQDSDAAVISCLSNRALCHIQLSEHAAVVDDCTAVLALQCDNVKALLRRSLAHEALHANDKALDDMLEVLRLDPSREEVPGHIERLAKDAGAN